MAAIPKLNLFVPLVPQHRLHSRFEHLRNWNGAEPARIIMTEVYRNFSDPDGNFVQQFQTDGFDSRIFELYLYAYLASSGYDIARNHPNPDFIVSHAGAACAIEATTSNPPGGDRARRTVPRDDLSPEELKNKIDHELPIRMGSPLRSKLDKRYNGKAYWELEQCKELPFVLAIEAFHEAESLFFTDAALCHYLYGLKWHPRWTKEGNLVLDSLAIKEHRLGAKTIPSNFFGQPGTEHISAVLFTNAGTFPKFNRMGYQAGYHRGNIKMFRRGTCLSIDPNSATPSEFGYDLDFPPSPETWGQGLVVFHNPNAARPLPRYFFRDAVTHYFDKNTLQTDVPDKLLIPFASITFVLCAEDSDLDADKGPREGIRSIRLDQFEALRPPRRSRTQLTSQEKEWFVTDNGSIVGTVAEDLIDNDWLYVMFKRNRKGNLKTQDLRCSIPQRMEARQHLLDAMETQIRPSPSSFRRRRRASNRSK
jgi:hypothetical protein